MNVPWKRAWSRIRSFTAELFRVPPSNFDHHPAIRCAVGVGVPIVTLAALGMPEMIPFGSFGALTGVFGRGEPHRMRLRSQLMAALLLMGSVGAALVVSSMSLGPAGIVVGATAVAFVGALVSGALGLKPAGSMFYVLAYAATVLIGASAPLLAFCISAASAVLSLIIGTAGWVLPGHHTPWEVRAISWPDRRGWASIAADGALHGIAVATAGSLAISLGLTHINWAMLTATVPLVGVSTSHRVNRGVQRVLGTLGGLVVAAAIFAWNPPLEAKLALLISLQFFIELYVTRNYALGQVFATPYSLVLVATSHAGSPWGLVGERGVETLLGAAVGVGLVYLGVLISSRR